MAERSTLLQSFAQPPAWHWVERKACIRTSYSLMSNPMHRREWSDFNLITVCCRPEAMRASSIPMSLVTLRTETVDIWGPRVETKRLWVPGCVAYLFDLLNYCTQKCTTALHCIELTLHCIGLLLFELSLPPRSEHQSILTATDSSVLNTFMLMTHPSKVHEVRLVVEKKEGVRERWREEGQRCGTHRG